MGDIALVNNDISVSQFSDISVVIEEDYDILQQAINSLKTIKGEMIWHPEIGNDIYNNRYKITSDMKEIVNVCENAIVVDDRIDTVELTATKATTYGSIDISFVIITTTGHRLVSNCQISIT